MNYKHQVLTILVLGIISANCLAQDSKQEVLKVVNTFFQTMEEKDSVGFNDLFLENAHAFSVREKGDSTITRSSILKASSSKDQLKERLRKEDITIHVNENVAAVWAPYDFWINDVHSHCGYEVFTLIKSQENWKIASLTYSVEKGSCKEMKRKI